MRRSKAGFTVAEILVSFFIFGLAMSILAYALVSSKNILAETVGSSDASQTLRKVYLSLEKDLRPGSYNFTDVTTSIGGPGSGTSGDALWFLSATDPATEAQARTNSARPLWLRNIVYYTAIPTNHASLYGSNCAGGANADGYDSFCPHKVLIRKTIDSGGPSVPGDEANEESLLTVGNIGAYLSAPTGFNVPLSGAEDAHVVAPALLTFRVEKAPIASSWPDELRFRIQATALEELGKTTKVGSTDLEAAPQTEVMEFSIFPEVP